MRESLTASASRGFWKGTAMKLMKKDGKDTLIERTAISVRAAGKNYDPKSAHYVKHVWKKQGTTTAAKL